jgi:hypothetical protein
MDYRGGRTFIDVFLVGFDPVGGYLGLRRLEIQFTGATSLWSFLSSASFTYEFQGEVLVDWGERLRMESDPPNESGIK